MSETVALAKYLEDYFKKGISQITGLYGGDISQAAKIRLESGEQFFVKWRENAPRGFFQAEIDGLNELRNCTKIRTPKPILAKDGTDDYPSFILLDYISPGSASLPKWRQLGQSLASLHQIKAESFGWTRDNFIGGSKQNNQQEQSWVQFFIERRLGAQVQLGKSKNWFTSAFSDLYDEKKEAIHSILSTGSDEPPVLVHGDLWSGNVYWSETGAVLIDPAVYYGNREVDLAFSELFGGFPPEFYRGYNEVLPLADGYDLRKKILNLYHLMNHASLFGGRYVDTVKSTLISI